MVTYRMIPISSLDKILPDGGEPGMNRIDGPVTGLAGETVSFQLAFRLEGAAEELRGCGANEHVARIAVRSGLPGVPAESVHIRAVRDVPVEFAAYPNADDGAYLSDRPGLYPDLLQDAGGYVAFLPARWQSLWVDIDLPEEDDPATWNGELEFSAEDRDGRRVASVGVSVRRIGARLPELELEHTEWLYADCLAQWYGVPVWSEEHWRIVERFVRLAAKRGVTMIYTPLFTPPLDTVVGGERPTTQLVGVRRTNGAWSFDFALLERWVAMCQAAGISRFEMSHLFTQWGAERCPKIVATVDGVERKVFGWSTAAADPASEYPEFLAAFLPELDRELHRLGIAGSTVFHVSDEPTTDNLDSYLAAKAVVSPYLGDYRIMDALSHIEFYDSGACEHPIPADDAIEPFVAAHVPGLWTYYCCAQTTDVPNRFMAMPSYRNRVLGFLLYAYDLAGFLHWGFNFYNTQFSLRPINPYVEPGTPEGFPAGDAFLVYPGPGGEPEESIRMMVMEEALNDLRACRLLESLVGRERVLALLNEGLDEPLAFARYPHSAAWLLGRRAAVDAAIERYAGSSRASSRH